MQESGETNTWIVVNIDYMDIDNNANQYIGHFNGEDHKLRGCHTQQTSYRVEEDVVIRAI